MRKMQIGVIVLMTVLMFSLSAIQPSFAWEMSGYDSIEEIADVDWYYWNSSSDSAAIILYGGYASYPADNVEIEKLSKPAGFPDSIMVAPMSVINNLHEWGFDILNNVDDVIYNISSSAGNDWLTSAAEWLQNEGYTNVYLFGYSAGGITTAYEIQKDGADELYTAAFIAAAPLDKYSDSWPLYATDENADETLLRTALICNENDDSDPECYSSMVSYFNNMGADSGGRRFHDWGPTSEPQFPFSYHDVFWFDCIDCGKNISEEVYDWFAADSYDMSLAAIDETYTPRTVPITVDGDWVLNTGDSYELVEGEHTLEAPEVWNTNYVFYRWVKNMQSYAGDEYENEITIDLQASDTYIALYFCPRDLTIHVVEAPSYDYLPLAVATIDTTSGYYIFGYETFSLTKGSHTVTITWPGIAQGWYAVMWQKYVGGQWVNTDVWYEFEITIDLQTNSAYRLVLYDAS